ncbi:carbohydrate kinase family protein [Flavobacterium sp. RHBU_3]|uniref:carbohydrate kinase family protein n=1 Tax=Flavobacterium sp. RHBU_3 TaxID=3391184 RepID=UPI0039853A7C
MPEKINAVSFGEVLWDVFPEGRKIGGAPLNLALRMQSLGCNAGMISCVGNDAYGDEIVTYVAAQGLNTEAIIRTESYPTGVVNVTLDNTGSASYDIHYPSAWDKIELNQAAEKLVENTDVLIYGSLACRDAVSESALEKLLHYPAFKVFDVNLRPPHYSIATIKKLIAKADFIKFNDDELLEIAIAMGSQHKTIEDNMQFIATATGITSMCVTRGKHGALLMWQGHLYNNDGYSVKVADTVGAGDSFLATLIMKLLSGENPQTALDYACAMGALVAASVGANPDITNAQVAALTGK